MPGDEEGLAAEGSVGAAVNLVLVTGSRDWKDYNAIWDQLACLPVHTIILQGGCPTGADAMAKRAAESLGFMPLTLGALWDRFGKAAGPIRNEAMAALMKEAHGTKAIAFLLRNQRNIGTNNCIAALKAVGIVAEKIYG